MHVVEMCELKAKYCNQDDQDRWKKFFVMCDAEGFGEVQIGSLLTVLEDCNNCPQELLEELNVSLLRKSLADMKSRGHTAIQYQEFVNILTRKRSLSFKCAVHARDRQIKTSDDFHSPQKKKLLSQLKTVIAKEIITFQSDREYFTSSKAVKLPLLMVSLSLMQIGFYFSHDLCDSLDMSPCQKSGWWRYFSYCLVHRDFHHVSMNIIAQIVVGVPLEIVYGPLRLLFLYMLGVFGGSLLSTALDCHTSLVGASGGSVGLVIAIVSYWIVHSPAPKGPGWLKVFSLLAYTSVEIGMAVYKRYLSDSPLSFCGHIGGVTAGIFMGNAVFKHLDMPLANYIKLYCGLLMYTVFYLVLLIYAILRNDQSGSIIHIIRSSN